MRIELIEPPAEGHSSGGYLYNAKHIEGAPPAPPWPHLGVALRAGLTTVWGAPD